MDRYKECERVLKVAAAQQCKERATLIKQDFAAIAKTTTGQIAPVAGAAELVRKCLAARGGAEAGNRQLRLGCEVLLDTLAFIEEGAGAKLRETDCLEGPEPSLQALVELLRGRTVDDQGTNTVRICHLHDHNGSIGAPRSGEGSIFRDFQDGFYQVDLLGDADVAAFADRPVASDQAQKAIDAYAKGAKGRYANQNLTILSDEDIPMGREPQSGAIADPAVAPKNLNIQHLFGTPGDTLTAIGRNPFEPYYERSGAAIPADPRDGDAVHYVGVMYPPLHTYHTRTHRRGADGFTIVSRNCLRRVYAERHTTLADRLLKRKGRGETAATDEPLAMMARATRGDHQGKDMVLINESEIRSQVAEATAPVEYVLSIGKDRIRAFKCATYTARLYPSMESKQRKACSSIFTSEITQARLQSRLLMKLLRYEYAWRSMASQWRTHNDVIAKAISNIEWGCMWQDWNFFTGGLVTEIDMQNVVQRLTQFREQEADAPATELRNVCYAFFDHINSVRDQCDKQAVVDEATLVPEIVEMYRTKVLAAFTECYRAARTAIYTDLRPLNSKSFPQVVAAILSSQHTVDERIAGDIPTMSDQFLDSADVLQMRLELLPKHNKDATDVLTLTSIDDIIDARLLEHPGFTGQPFLDLFHDAKGLDARTGRRNITSTAMDLHKQCAEAYRSNTLATDKHKIAKAISVINALVLLLKCSDRLFNGAKKMQEFLGAPHSLPADVVTWIIGLFYERTATDEFALGAKGLQRLMCYTMWLCIYLSGGKHAYNFATMRNVDLKTKRQIHALFDKCVPIAGLVANTKGKSSSYTIGLPLGGIPKAATPAFRGLVGTIAGMGKRARR